MLNDTLNCCPRCGAREGIDGHACPEGKEADRCAIGKKQVSTEPVNTNGLNANAYKAACEARMHYRGYTDVLAYTIAGEDAAFINAYIAESSNGRKADFESVNAGSIPTSASSTLIERMEAEAFKVFLARGDIPLKDAIRLGLEAAISLRDVSQREIPVIHDQVIGILWEQHKARSYEEDSADENGNYSCLCSQCDLTFTGHKRRAVCKACARENLAAHGVASSDELIGDITTNDSECAARAIYALGRKNAAEQMEMEESELLTFEQAKVSNDPDERSPYESAIEAAEAVIAALPKRESIAPCKHPEDCDYPDCGTRVTGGIKCNGEYANSIYEENK